jgi:hypothetical protein
MNNTAVLLMRERRVLDKGFVEVVIWQVPGRLRGSSHSYKYRLAYVVQDRCVLRYDNEPGKGDHRHLGAAEQPYTFVSVDQLLDDFLAEVAAWSEC